MRFRLSLNRTTKQRMLPMDYQYYISTWIYKVLRHADEDFAHFLHDRGYGQNDSKLYKLFCFSPLHFGKPILWKDKKLFEIVVHEIGLRISFDVPEAALNFIKGLFMQQSFYLGDKFNGIDFTVTKVETLPEATFTETMKYHLVTPWVVGFQSEQDKYPEYLSPDDQRFHSLAVKHLVEKYNNTRKSHMVSPEQIQLRITSPFKRAGFVMKPGTAEESRVVGNLFDFEMTAPLEIHRMIWNAGISEKSSTGFGWVETIKGKY